MGNKIKLKNVSYTYNGREMQLKNISLNVKQGEVVLLTGRSGCGKTTLTRIINGLIPHFFEGEFSGDIFIDKNNAIDMKMWERGEMIGNVFQDPRSQFFANEVEGEIAFSCENYGLTHDMIRKQVNNSIKWTDIVHLKGRKLVNLSYGERQKVAIASANAINPKIYVMDEPSANLDMASANQFALLLKKLKSEGATIVIAEHRIYYLIDIADRIVYMTNGEISAEFTPKELMEMDYKKIESLGFRTPDLSRLKHNFKSSGFSGDKSISLKNIDVTLNRSEILNDISFSADVGEVVAVIGSNGAGKSTLGRLMAGLVKEKQGKVVLNNKTLKARARRGLIWYIMQDLDSQMFGESLLAELLIGNTKPTKELEDKAVSLLKKLGLYKLRNTHPQCLSGGQKQRLVLGAALMRDTKVLILDEPTSGLDGVNMRKVAKLIRGLSDEDRTIFVITHDYELIMNLCDRIIHLEDGVTKNDTQSASEKEIMDIMMKQ